MTLAEIGDRVVRIHDVGGPDALRVDRIPA